jgi:hypothetical protein
LSLNNPGASMPILTMQWTFTPTCCFGVSWGRPKLRLHGRERVQ